MNFSESSAAEAPFICAVCEEPARGFHFGAFTCEGCKSFFGRSATKKSGEKFECKNDRQCDVKGSNRTSCKSCRFQACLEVGMSPTNSRFGRRSKYFKISMAKKHQTNSVHTTVQQKSSNDVSSFIPSSSSIPILQNDNMIFLYSIMINQLMQKYFTSDAFNSQKNLSF